ncbi:MAG: UDP-3-O-acyl-N-acetylglucosamine deacetylase [Pseudomonadota bacterium]
MIQRTTLTSAAVCAGVGLHSGARVRMVMKPAPVGAGIVFERSDLELDDCMIAARWDQVRSTDLGTTLINEAGASVATVEHFMAALAGLGVDDVIVELDGPEVPAMDGSSKPFVDLLLRAGLTQSAAPRRAVQVLRPVCVEEGGRRAELLPALNGVIDVEIDFDDPAIGRQSFAFDVSPQAFMDLVAPARTFGFRRDYDKLVSMGLARGGSMDNAIVIEDDGVANPEGLRFADEFVRHKALDALGDLYLAGLPILGLYKALRPGHGLNNRMLRALFADEANYKIVSMRETAATTRQAVRG